VIGTAIQACVYATLVIFCWVVPFGHFINGFLQNIILPIIIISKFKLSKSCMMDLAAILLESGSVFN